MFWKRRLRCREFKRNATIALVDFTKEHEKSARNLEELGNALGDNRLAAEEAGTKVAEEIIKFCRSNATLSTALFVEDLRNSCGGQ